MSKTVYKYRGHGVYKIYHPMKGLDGSLRLMRGMKHISDIKAAITQGTIKTDLDFHWTS